MEKTYVQIIRELREDNDRTQQELADYLGTSQTMYARILFILTVIQKVIP